MLEYRDRPFPRQTESLLEVADRERLPIALLERPPHALDRRAGDDEIARQAGQLAALPKIAHHALEDLRLGVELGTELAGRRRREAGAVEARQKIGREPRLLAREARRSPRLVHQIAVHGQDLLAPEPVEVDVGQIGRPTRQDAPHRLGLGHAARQAVLGEVVGERRPSALGDPLVGHGVQPALAVSASGRHPQQPVRLDQTPEARFDLATLAPEAPGERVRRRAALAGFAHPLHERRVGALGQRPDRALEVGAALARPARIEDQAPTQGALRRKPADDEAVAANRRHRLRRADLHRAGAPRLDGFAVERAEAGGNLGRQQVEPHLGRPGDRLGRIGQQPKARLERRRRLDRAGGDELHAALDLVGVDARKPQRGPLAGLRALALLAVHLDAADPHADAGRQELERVTGGDPAAGQGSGGHHAEALEHEGAVDRQACRPVRLGRGLVRVGEAGELGAQPVEAGAGDARYRHDRRVTEGGAGDELFDLELSELDQILGHQVRLGQRDDAGRYAEERADGQVLPGLRLHPFVGGDHQQHDPDAAQPGQRIVQEPLVARYVDEADLEVAFLEMGEADVDGDAAVLLLAPAVAVDTGKRLDERCLAVVDVAGSADDDPAHQADSFRISRARRLIVPPSAWPAKRASISFMIGPMALGPERPSAAMNSRKAVRISSSPISGGM